jgi:hypothetical protein
MTHRFGADMETGSRESRGERMVLPSRIGRNPISTNDVNLTIRLTFQIRSVLSVNSADFASISLHAGADSAAPNPRTHQLSENMIVLEKLNKFRGLQNRNHSAHLCPFEIPESLLSDPPDFLYPVKYSFLPPVSFTVLTRASARA